MRSNALITKNTDVLKSAVKLHSSVFDVEEITLKYNVKTMRKAAQFILQNIQIT